MIEQSIYTALSAITGVNGVSAVVIPQNSTLPQIRYSQVSTDIVPDHSSGDKCEHPIYQVDIYCKDYQQCKTIKEEIKQAMTGSLSCSYVSASGDGYDPESRAYYFSQDFKIWSS